jgi:hypothetical protein
MKSLEQKNPLNKKSNANLIAIRALNSPVTLAHKKIGKKWHCTALQFDLVGIGKSRSEAMHELKGILNTYLCEIIKTTGPVRVFNPSDAEEWECEDKQEYNVTIAILSAKTSTVMPERLSIPQARRYRNQIQAIDLIPCQG